MVGKDTVVYGQSLIGKRVWLNNTLVEVMELDDKPKSARVHVMFSRTREELDFVSLDELEQITSPSATSSDDIVGQKFMFGEREVIVLCIATEAHMGRVRVEAVSNPSTSVYAPKWTYADVENLKPYIGIVSGEEYYNIAPHRSRRVGDIEGRLKAIETRLATLVDETRMLTAEIRLLNENNDFDSNSEEEV